MPDDLYQRDIVRWCNQQADLLRRLAAGERLNEYVDWPNVIEEIEALGRSETRACESFLRLALLHMLKQLAWPQHKAVPHWREETWHYLFDRSERSALHAPATRSQRHLPPSSARVAGLDGRAWGSTAGSRGVLAGIERDARRRVRPGGSLVKIGARIGRATSA